MSRKHPVNRTNTQTATEMHPKSIRDEADTLEGEEENRFAEPAIPGGIWTTSDASTSVTRQDY
jgi:hypothetical protein